MDPHEVCRRSCTYWSVPVTFYEPVVLQPQYVTNNARFEPPPRPTPHFYYHTAIESPSAEENRRFFLKRSVFDLVAAYPFLSLTDPKLLGWYYALSPEDKKLIRDEGGFHPFLQRHPALEFSKYVQVKYDTGRASPVQKGKICKSHNSFEGQSCRCEMSYTQQELEMLPSNVRDTLSLPSCSNSRNIPLQDSYDQLQDSFQTTFNSSMAQDPNHQMAHTVPTAYQLNQDQAWQMSNSSSITVRKDPSTLASFSVDTELERCKQAAKPELSSQISVTQSQTTNFSYPKVGPSQSERPTVKSKSLSEWYSFDSIQMDAAEQTDSSIIKCLREGCQDPTDYSEEQSVDDSEARCEDSTDIFHSVMEDDQSILACLPQEEMTAFAGVSETLRSDQPAETTADKFPSPLPCVTTCDVMVETEQTPYTPAFTQTEKPQTSDKDIITEVHMADLDYLAEEFMKLRTAKEELRAQKEKMKNCGCKLRKECDCMQRAQQAELGLLALQYSMCRQHCWRLYCNSAERDHLTPLPANLPADIVGVLHKLECDLNEMRDQILAGVPLQQLKPLSVDCTKITTGEYYTPAQIIGDVLGNLSSCSKKLRENQTLNEEKRCSSGQSGNTSQRKEKEIKKETTKAKQAVTLDVQEKNTIIHAQNPEEKQTTISCKELNSNEAWYDAEEDLEPAGRGAAAEREQDPAMITKDVTSGEEEIFRKDAKNSVLFVSNLPSNVTENDMMVMFEKYSASEVSISALKNGLSVAIVMISGPQAAKAAVRELNGCSMQGRTLHVEHINRAASESQNQASLSVRGPGSSQHDNKPQTSNTDPRKTERKLIPRPLLSSSIKNKEVVCIYPTPKATCVPQHYCTMGSFDTLMAELTQRHSGISRQRIVDALIELRAKHQGVLSGLPLRTIRDMTSELLTRPATAAQL
ncbi:RNA-binding protein 44 isoform X2 [Cheilinus undulatus]|uniref:RNA-binding protein 44 isoform X2 n=1 Tax=Cheilinus undulatus TaxID=241271 RepID=UPI001BD69038|nr:RNA-binding protein 44 isoform X2 [Cheilinus undulatus]